MSMMGTLAKVAVGIAVAKGVGSMMNKRSSGGQAQTGNGGLLGAGQDQIPQDQAGLEDLLGGLLGGRNGGAGGGLGGMLEQLTGGQGGGAGGGLGGLGDLLGNLTGGQQGGGALGGLLGGLLGGASSSGGGGSFGDVLNQSLQRRGEPETAPSREQEAMAALMLRAMIQAAKSDGKIDDNERKKILENLGEVSPEEREFVNHELGQPIDVEGLARQVPRGLEQQVYAMSVIGIDLDNRNEAQYLHELATAMNIGQNEVNAMHDQLGVPRIYS